uniref:Ig-like domain-containing protein n=1 Tax=Maylandia zebra TaxID=106582 RepID=A0A3P9BGE0_9CICH
PPSLSPRVLGLPWGLLPVGHSRKVLYKNHFIYHFVLIHNSHLMHKPQRRFAIKEISLTNVSLSELRVKMSPSAVVTEGQRVTLTCSTSCPLTDNTNYIWYLNSRPLTPRENQNKYLILDPVSREDAGSYSCAVKTNKDISSAPKTLTTLTVQSITGTWTPAAAGVSAALLVLILLTVCCTFNLYPLWWSRTSRSPGSSPSCGRRDRSSAKETKHLFLHLPNLSYLGLFNQKPDPNYLLNLLAYIYVHSSTFLITLKHVRLLALFSLI